MKLNYRQVLSIFQDLAALPPPTEVGGFRAWSSVKDALKLEKALAKANVI